jgi:hypothetical protein
VIAAIPRSAAAPARELESGPPGKVFTYRRSDFLMPPAGTDAPQAFLVELAPSTTIAPHFHREDEFQVVVGGGGSLGTHPLRGVAVHFADAYTPYGPIRAGADGLVFFTLRARADAGALYMPGSRAALARKARRSVAADVSPDGARGALWAAHDDGLAAWAVHARPGEDVAHPEGDGGRYYLVVEGALEREGVALPRWSCVWAGSGAARPRLTARPAGAEVVVVQFPRSERAATARATSA